MEKTRTKRSVFQTSNRELFEFLTEERGHTEWCVKLQRGAYIASFTDSVALQTDVAEFQRRNGRVVRTTNDLLHALTTS